MAPAEIIRIGEGAGVRRDGDLWCLTDLWRAAGADEKKRPAEWLRKDGAPHVEFLRDSLDMAQGHNEKPAEIVKTTRGGSGERGATWAHWQLALSYAKWLSPAFAAKVNAVYKAFVDGELVARRQLAEQVPHIVLRLQAHAAARRGTFSEELKAEFLRLRRIDWDGKGSEPQGLAFAYGRTWRLILGDAVYKELKARNPHPREGSSHSQWLRDEAYKLAKESDLVVACSIARRSPTWSVYEHEMRGFFRRTPLQLGLVRADRRPFLAVGGA